MTPDQSIIDAILRPLEAAIAAPTGILSGAKLLVETNQPQKAPPGGRYLRVNRIEGLADPVALGRVSNLLGIVQIDAVDRLGAGREWLDEAVAAVVGLYSVAVPLWSGDRKIRLQRVTAGPLINSSAAIRPVTISYACAV